MCDVWEVVFVDVGMVALLGLIFDFLLHLAWERLLIVLVIIGILEFYPFAMVDLGLTDGIYWEQIVAFSGESCPIDTVHTNAMVIVQLTQ